MPTVIDVSGIVLRTVGALDVVQAAALGDLVILSQATGGSVLGSGTPNVSLPGLCGQVVLAEIQGWDVSAAATRTVAVSDRRYREAAPGWTFDDVLIEPPGWERALSLLGDGGAEGALSINNTDGRYDDMAEDAWEGRPVLIKTVEGAYSGAVTVHSAVVSQVAFDLDRVTVSLTDRRNLLEQPLEASLYAGDGSDYGGGADLKGKPRPVAYGRVWNAPLQPSSTVKNLYVLHDGKIVQIERVKVRGIEVLPGYARASAADLAATLPVTGTYDWWIGASGSPAAIRLGSPPGGDIVTADFIGEDLPVIGAPGDPSSVFLYLVDSRSALSAADLVELDLHSLYAQAPYGMGLFVEGGTGETQTVADLLTRVAGTVGASWWLDADGKLRVKQIVAPASPAVWTAVYNDGGGTRPTLAFNEFPAIDLSIEQARPPVWRVVLKYRRAWHEQRTGLDANISATQRLLIANAWRDAVAEDATVKTAWPNARVLEVETLLDIQAEAEAEAARLLALHKVARRRISVTLDALDAPAALDLGQVVRVVADRFGLSAGVFGIVYSIRRWHDQGSGRWDVGIWA